MLKAGVLYPRSGIYPLLGTDFLQGIRLSLLINNCKEQIELLTENISFGIDEKEVYNKTEKLLLEENADVVVAFLDLKIISVLQPLFSATGKLLIVVNPGANYPENWVPSPGTLYLTLLDSYFCYLTGKKAASEGYSRSLMAASFYDGGYQHGGAMINGYIKNGGSLRYNYISQLKLKEFDTSPLVDFLSANEDVRSLLCLFSGKEANLFYSNINDWHEAGSLKLFVSPAMLEEKNCKELNVPLFFQASGYIPWNSTLNNEANALFKNIMQKESKSDANIFSLLGWETGLLLQLLTNSNIEITEAGKLIQLLYTTPLNSPRGLLQTDPSTHYIISPAHYASLDNNAVVTINETVDTGIAAWELFTKEEQGIGDSGWTNTYLCY